MKSDLDRLFWLRRKNHLVTQRKLPILLRSTERWVFHLPEHFNLALGIEEAKQGALFSFHAGDTIYDHPDGGTEVWGKAIKSVTKIVQVMHGIPVRASKKDTRDGAPEDARIPRVPGLIDFQVMNVRNGKIGEREHHSCTQDDFVGYLITGLLIDLSSAEQLLPPPRHGEYYIHPQNKNRRKTLSTPLDKSDCPYENNDPS